MRVVSVKTYPELLETAAQWFHEKWHVSLEAYRESMTESLSDTAVPQWYIVLNDESEIIAGVGVIENDFHKRKDLAPNICAVYVEEAYRGQGIAPMLLEHACAKLSEAGIADVYLITGHTGLYERYGWDFYGMIEEDEGTMIRCYHRRTDRKR